MKKYILHIMILFCCTACNGADLYKNLYKEDVFNKEIEPTEMTVKDYFGASRLDNPVVLSDEYLINLYKTRGYITAIKDYSIQNHAKNENQKECIKQAEKEMSVRFQDNKIKYQDKIVKTYNNYILNECLD